MVSNIYGKITVDERFAKGLELFNEGEYFDCHEVIEDLWLETASNDMYRDLYKGVIQAAAAIYQWDRGILTGARGLYAGAVGYLEKYRPRALGLDVEKMVNDLKACFRPLETWDGQAQTPRSKARTPVLRYEAA